MGDPQVTMVISPVEPRYGAPGQASMDGGQHGRSLWHVRQAQWMVHFSKDQIGLERSLDMDMEKLLHMHVHTLYNMCTYACIKKTHLAI